MGKKEYLEILLSQIRNEKAKKMVGDEIGAHIDDQTSTYMDFGLDQETAEKRAVRTMGDPVETGVSLDRIHKPKMSWDMIIMVSIIAFWGLILQFLIGTDAGSMDFFKHHLMYTIIGLVMMMLICFIDYSRLVQRGREIAVVYLVFCGICLLFGERVNGTNLFVNLGPFGFSMHFMLYLSIPIFACLLYLYRKMKRRHLLIPIGFMAVLFLMYYWKTASILLLLNVGLIAGVVLTYALLKGWYPMNAKRAVATVWSILIGCPLIAVAVVLNRLNNGQSAGYIAHRLDYFLKEGGSYVAINGQFRPIKQILQEAFFIGGNTSLMVDEAGPVDNIACDYVLIHLTSYYGLFILLVLIALLVLFCVTLFRVSFKQKNQVGTIIGIGCGTVFAVQIAEYVLMNLGLMPGTTVFLPLISYGGTGTCVAFILLGLLLSIYRYQNLVSEPKKRKRLVIKLMDV